MNENRLGLCSVPHLGYPAELPMCAAGAALLDTARCRREGGDTQPILTISGLSGSQVLTLAQLKTLLGTRPDCVVGLDGSGQATAFMPEMDCYFWMRELIQLDIR